MTAAARPLPRRWWIRPLVAALAARLIAYLGVLIGSTDRAAAFADYPPFPLLHDAAWYARIAVEGYHGVPPGSPAGNLHDISFLPLWPALLRLVSLPVGDDLTAVALVGSLVASALSVAGVLVIYRLFFLRYGPDAAPGAYLVALAPPAFAGALAYGDPLALLLVAAWWWPSLERRGWVRAGLGLALGALRLPAIALIADAASRRGRSLAGWLLPAAGIVVGLALYAGLVALVTGDPLGLLRGTASVTTDAGGKGIIPFLTGEYGLFSGFERFTAPALVALLGVALSLRGLVALARSGERSDALVAGAIVALAILAGSWPSWWRYLLFALPIHAALARSLGPRRTAVYAAGFALLLLVSSILSASTDIHP